MNADLQIQHAHIDPQIEHAKSEKDRALTSAYWCYFLAGMIMCVTAWFVVQGVSATEPDSPARSAKIAAGILLLIIEGCAFDLAGRWSEFSRPLRFVGWAMFCLQVACMTLAQYSTATTAGKAAALSTATANEIIAQSKAVRETASAVQADSDRLKSSKHQWKRDEGVKKSETALAAVSSTGSVEKLEKLKDTAISTPWVETLGSKWLFAFSFVFSVIFEGTGIVLMHVAGSLQKKAADGQPVESQILTLLRKMNAQPSPAPLEKQTQKEEQKPADSETESNFQMGFIPRETKTQAVEALHDSAAPGELWIPKQRREYVLRPTKAPTAPDPVHSPAPTPATPKPAPAPEPEQTVPDRVQDAVLDRVRDSAPANTPEIEEGAPVPVPTAPQRAQPDTPAPKVVKQRISKPRAAAPTVRYDTGTDADSVRYRDVVAAVQARKIKPSFSAIEKLAGCRQSVAANFRNAMHASGIIEPDPEKPGQFRLKEANTDKAQLALQGA